jgi:hypothetical protein
MGKTATVSHLQLNQSSEAKLVLPSKLNISSRDLSVPEMQVERASSRQSRTRATKNPPATSMAHLNEESRKRRVEALQKFMRGPLLVEPTTKPNKMLNVTNTNEQNPVVASQRNVRSAHKGLKKVESARKQNGMSTQRSRK